MVATSGHRGFSSVTQDGRESGSDSHARHHSKNTVQQGGSVGVTATALATARHADADACDVLIAGLR